MSLEDSFVWPFLIIQKSYNICMEEKLNKRQLQFCYEYLKDFNGTQAAIRTGYSAKSAASIAAENLRKPQITEQIRNLSENLFKSQGLSTERILSEVTSIAFSGSNSNGEKLKALEILLKHKQSKNEHERDLNGTAQRILAAVAKSRPKS